MVYQEFKARYNILGAKEVAKAKNDKSAAGAVLELVKLDKDKYRLGHTKIFFRAGIGGWMEEQREEKIGSVLATIIITIIIIIIIIIVTRCLPGCSPGQEERLQGCNSRSSNRENCLSTLARGPLGGCSLPEPGSGCKYGWVGKLI